MIINKLLPQKLNLKNIKYNNKIPKLNQTVIKSFSNSYGVKTSYSTPTVYPIASIIYPLINFNSNILNIENLIKLKQTDNFSKYKTSLLRYLKEHQYENSFIEDIKISEDHYNIDSECSYLISRLINNIAFSCENGFDITEHIQNKNFSDEIDNVINNIEKKNSDKILPIAKLISKPDKKTEIIAIKKQLKQNYQANDLFFNNNIEAAKSTLESFKILNKNNIKYNGTIIITDLINYPGINLDSTNGNYILINIDHWQMAEFTPKKLILHEILHSLQPRKLSFRIKEIPTEFKEVANNVSDYAENNFAGEVHCELYVKKLLEGLSEKENELFNYLGGDFLK